MLEYDRFNTRKVASQGSYDDVIIGGLATIPSEHKEAFYEAFGREQLLRAYAEGKQTVSLTHKQIGDDGQVHWNQTTIIFMTDTPDDDIVQITLSHCVDEEKATEAALQDAVNRAQAANNAKLEFISQMSHDMRTPMNAILGSAALGLEEASDEATQSYFKDISVSAQLLLTLINDVLDMSRLDSATVTLRPEPYPLEDFRAFLSSAIEPLASAKNIALSVSSDRIACDCLLLDRTRINEIITNLLSNAVKFTPEGGKVSLDLEIDRIAGTRMRLTVRVSDTGVGMSEAFQERMFEPFVREDTPTASSTEGTGLGLSIVKS